MILLWTVSYTTAFIVTWGYTAYLFPNDDPPYLGLSVFCLWLFGAFLMTLLLFAATLVKSSYGALIVTGAVSPAGDGKYSSACTEIQSINPCTQQYGIAHKCNPAIRDVQCPCRSLCLLAAADRGCCCNIQEAAAIRAAMSPRAAAP